MRKESGDKNNEQNERKTKELKDDNVKIKEQHNPNKTQQIIKQLEEWTEKRIRDIIFDSNIDNWNRGKTLFGERIKNKEHLIFIVEDTEGNIFGGYVNEKIGTEEESYILDPNAFVFSLESKGRLKEMMKFDINEYHEAFYYDTQYYNFALFVFGTGRDISVCKEIYKTESYCSQWSFNYKGISNPFCGKCRFIPQRIIVIEVE
ncbi:Hypothetical protein EHI5A_115730 [Entamoeba histolytica KU27]|nr:Hypothetical protein EHI5A_115730 [Entamoeba histolytica KU27]